MATYLDGYGTNAKTPAQIAALTKCTIDDFKTGLSYLVPRRIGMANTGTDELPVWEERFELVPKIVYRATINTDLLEFESLLKQGRALSPTSVTPSEFGIQAAKSKGLLLDEHGEDVVAAQEALKQKDGNGGKEKEKESAKNR